MQVGDEQPDKRSLRYCRVIGIIKKVRGGLISLEDRQVTNSVINEAIANGRERDLEIAKPRK
jgi:hypothetical protein